jgi:hypothetical protein
VSTLCTTPAKGMHPGHTVNIIHSCSGDGYSHWELAQQGSHVRDVVEGQGSYFVVVVYSVEHRPTCVTTPLPGLNSGTRAARTSTKPHAEKGSACSDKTLLYKEPNMLTMCHVGTTGGQGYPPLKPC